MQRERLTSTGRGGVEAYRLFFPAAMLHAAVVLPLTVVAITTGAPTGLASGPAHGGEMLAGYALAVIAGFLLPPLPAGHMAALFGLWLAGRLAVLTGLPAVLAVVPSVAFAAGIAWRIVPRFTKSAKKLRNQATGPLVGLIAAAVSAAVLLVAWGAAGAGRLLLYAVVTLLAALLLFMGGRVIAPAATGARHRQGERVVTRVQPRLEGAMLLCFIPVVAGLAFEPLRPLAAIGAAGAGIAGLARLVRWQLWRCRGRPDLWALGAGYAWVGAGLLLMAGAWSGAGPVPILGLHAITVGGLGTLSLNVMGRTWLQRAKADPARATVLPLGALLVGLAAVARMAAIVLPSFALNWVAAVAWSLAFTTALAGLLRGVGKAVATG